MLPRPSLALLRTIADALAARPTTDAEAHAFAAALHTTLGTAPRVATSTVADPTDPAVRARRFDAAAAYLAADDTRVRWSTVTPRLHDDGTPDPAAALCADDTAGRGWAPVTPDTIRRFVIVVSEDRDTMVETVETIPELEAALAEHLSRSDDTDAGYGIEAVLDTDAPEAPTVAFGSLRLDAVLLVAA